MRRVDGRDGNRHCPCPLDAEPCDHPLERYWDVKHDPLARAHTKAGKGCCESFCQVLDFKIGVASPEIDDRRMIASSLSRLFKRSINVVFCGLVHFSNKPLPPKNRTRIFTDQHGWIPVFLQSIRSVLICVPLLFSLFLRGLCERLFTHRSTPP